MNVLGTIALILPLLQSGDKPTFCFDNQFEGDPASAKVGRWVTYLTEIAGHKDTDTIKVVGRVDDDWLIEHHLERTAMDFTYLFRVGPDKKIKQAWAAAKGDARWTPITVKESFQGRGVTVKETKQSEERKEIKAGKLDCTRIDLKVDSTGKEYRYTYWYSKRVWSLHRPSEHGGLVAWEGSLTKSVLDAMGEDATPTHPLPP